MAARKKAKVKSRSRKVSKRRKTPKKVKKRVKKAKISKKTARKGSRKPAGRKVVRKPTNEDILEKYSKQTGMAFKKPTSLSEFDKHLEETAKLVSGEPKEELPHFEDHHIEEAKKVEKPTEDDVPTSKHKEPEYHNTPDPEHDTLSAHHSHPYTEHSSHLFEEKHDSMPKHHRTAVNATILAFFGVVVPLISILGFIVALVAVKRGSHTGKGAVLLSVATFIINLALVYFFYTMALGVS